MDEPHESGGRCVSGNVHNLTILTHLFHRYQAGDLLDDRFRLVNSQFVSQVASELQVKAARKAEAAASAKLATLALLELQQEAMCPPTRMKQNSQLSGNTTISEVSQTPEAATSAPMTISQDDVQEFRQIFKRSEPP